MIMDDPYLWVIPQCRQGILTVFILKSVDVTHVVGLSPLVHSTSSAWSISFIPTPKQISEY